MDSPAINGLNTPGTSILSTQGGTFGDNPFLSLLVAQMRSQTPLEPVDNQSFMQQMSSYSTMQQQHELNDNLLQLLDYQGVLARLQGLSEGSSLLGKEVTFAGEGGTEERGVVEAVFVAEDGAVKLRVGERELDLRDVTGIHQPPAAS
jgi:flagellar basal-body rod modification protein FlgD